VRGRRAYDAWNKAATGLDAEGRAGLGDPIAASVAASIKEAIAALKADFSREGAKLATRQSSQKVLEALLPVVPGLLGGSADLTGSNGTLTKQHVMVAPPDYAGNYIYYGVREHEMGAAMNGLSLHGGFVPYGGTFLVFSDYCRPAIRLSALMGRRVIYVMTHDSIGLGEDGPTHQPVEHLASLRAMPNVNVFRPADSVECAECWELSLLTPSTPAILALSRQGLPLLRKEPSAANLSAKGAYVLAEPEGGRDVTLLATGSELMLAVEAAKALAVEGIRAAVISMPCWELFEAQDKAYRDGVLGSAPRIAIEAGVEFGWSRWLGPDGVFIGMHRFGASAPAPELYKKFGITADAVVAAARELTGKR
jgi:transketolase